MRANSLTNLGVALDYNVASDYDKVLVLSGIASEIEELAPHANEIATLVANLPDVLTVQEASELVNNLTVKVTTLPEGSTATSELIGTEIRLGIPAGTQGVQGIQGPKGDKGDRGDIGLTGAKGPAGATGPQGPRGFRGEDGIDGEGVVITSIFNNLNKSLTINFSDGTQHTTDPLKGEDGRSVTITNVVNNANGTMLINFSDGTSHHTTDLTGPRGFKGDTGDHVHHISYQRSKDPLGNEVGPVTPSQKGHTDTYAMWASQEELPEMYIGEFTVYNGLNTLTAEEQVKFESIEFGATADQEAFEVPYDNTISGLLSEDVQSSIDELTATKLNLIEKGQPNGVAELDSNGLVPSTQLPSYVDDVLEFPTYADLPVEGESDKIYIVVTDETSNGDTSSYRWTGTAYAMVSNTLNEADIKALYEANPDTNAYTDASVAKLDVDTALNTIATTLPTAINELKAAVDLNTAKQTNVTTDLSYTAGVNEGTIVSSDGTDAVIPAADATNAGLMLAVEKSKLADIEDGATADQTAEEILTLLKTVDGSGSELDADLLDGQEGAYYLNAGNINAGTIDDARLPDTITSDITGNAATATKLETVRTIALTGDVTGDVSFDGSENVSITTIVADDSHDHIIDNVDGLQDALDSIGEGIADLVDEVALKAYADNATLTGVPTAPTAAVGDETTQVATTAFVVAEIASEAYSKTQLDAGQLDNRYYTETEIDTKLAEQNDASEISYDGTVSELVATNVQDAMDEVEGRLDAVEGVVAETNLTRADKYLASKNIARLIYESGNLTKIRYTIDSDVDYEVLTYSGEDLVNVAHYIYEELKGNTVLTYASGELVSSIFIGV